MSTQGEVGYNVKLCTNCDQDYYAPCYVERYCEGCDTDLCAGCYDEHNNGAPSHDDPRTIK